MTDKNLTTTGKQDYFARLRADGLTVKEAAKQVGFHEKYGYAVERKLQEGNLTHPKTRKLASNALQNFLQGKAFGDIKDVPASVTMSAVKEVYDRVHPKTNINVSTVTKVNVDNRVTLDQFKDKARSARDITLDMPKAKESNLEAPEDDMGDK
jgi:transposase